MSKLPEVRSVLAAIQLCSIVSSTSACEVLGLSSSLRTPWKRRCSCAQFVPRILSLSQDHVLFMRRISGSLFTFSLYSFKFTPDLLFLECFPKHTKAHLEMSWVFCRDTEISIFSALSRCNRSRSDDVSKSKKWRHGTDTRQWGIFHRSKKSHLVHA